VAVSGGEGCSISPASIRGDGDLKALKVEAGAAARRLLCIQRFYALGGAVRFRSAFLFATYMVIFHFLIFFVSMKQESDV
jgi:hypothetical protein